MPLAGNHLSGDRVVGDHGISGTVVGLPTRSALRTVAVYVRWDDGREGDERITNIRPCPKSISRAHNHIPHTFQPLPASSTAYASPRKINSRSGSPAEYRSHHQGAGRSPGSSTTSPPASPSSPVSYSGFGTPPTRRGGVQPPINSTGSGTGRPRSAGPPTGTNRSSGTIGSPTGMNRSPSAGSPTSASHPPTGSNRSSPVPQTGSNRSSPGNSPSTRTRSPRSGGTGQITRQGSGVSGGGISGGARYDAGPVTVATAKLRGGVTRKAGSGRGSEVGEALRRHSQSLGAKDVPKPSHRKRNDSQWYFAEPTQTVILFDWDDTLFPTSYLTEDLRFDWRFPIAHQGLDPSTKREVSRKLAQCERYAMELLQRASDFGHVVVVTLAAKGWVEQSCRFFYTKVGELLRSLKIKIVYAQAKVKARETCMVMASGKPVDANTMEAFYGQLKGRAMAEEIDRFYTQYEGQTWKNVLSIGDSRFERYGLMAASTAYMQQRRLSLLGSAPFLPAERGAWQKVDADDKKVHLRVKVCKLIDSPDLDELAIELEMVTRWLGLMTNLNEGFDLDLEGLVDASMVSVVESALKGDRPVSDLPSPPSQAAIF